MKQKNLVLLCLLIFISLMCHGCIFFNIDDGQNGNNNGGAGKFAGGSGNADDPYLIETADQLDAVRDHLNKHFLLISDIDLVNYQDGVGWIPLGNETPFSGVFNGNDFKVTNLLIKNLEGELLGLFGTIAAGATIRNLGVVDACIEGKTKVGILAGENRGTIEYCFVRGEVKGHHYHIGGLLGYNNGIDGNVGLVSICFSSVTVSGANGLGNSFGGLIGTNFSGTVEQSLALGDVFGNINVIGGLVGHNYQGTIIDCFTLVNVTGASNNSVGGLVGQNSFGLIIQCVSGGSVVAEQYYIGGLCGWNTGEIVKCFAEGTVWGDSYVGGLVGYHEGTAAIISNSFAGGDVVATGERVGGLVGQATYSKVEYCYSVGEVAGASYLGGLIGAKSSFEGSVAEVIDSYYDLTTSNQTDNAGKGIPKTTEEMKQQNTFTNWDFTAIWAIDEDISYPFLVWFF